MSMTLVTYIHSFKSKGEANEKIQIYFSTSNGCSN